MNILYINHYAGSPRHGMEFRPYYLAREWVKTGHQVMIVAADRSHLRHSNPVLTRSYQDEIIDGIHYIWCRTLTYEHNGLRRALNIFGFLLRLVGVRRRYLHGAKLDIVIASSTYPFDMILAAWIARRTGATLVYEVHDLWPLTPIEIGGMSPYHPFILLMRWAEGFAYRRADVVVSMLPHAKGYMLQQGMAPEKYHVVPSGVSLAEWQQSAPLPAAHLTLLAELAVSEYFLVGYAGGHGLANALEYLLEAALALQAVPVAFLLVGDGPDKLRLIDIVRQLGLSRVYFLPPIPKRAMSAWLARMDVLFIGWRQRSIYRFGINPNKLFDYMMAGKPVIHSVAAANDIVEDAKAGVSVPPEDPLAIAQAVRHMMALSVAQRNAMGANGKAYVLARHDYRRLADQFLAACSPTV